MSSDMQSSSRRSEEPEASHERWLVSYADFITLMFAFFAVLYATSQKDVEKTQKFEESVKKYLIKAGMGFGARSGSSRVGSEASDERSSPIETPITTFHKQRAEAAKDTDDAEALLESNLSKEERKRYVLDLASDEWGARLILSSPQIFADRSDKFNGQAITFLGKLSGLLAKSKRKILIEGHVGSNEVGNQKSTWDFASSRAVNLLRFVQKREHMEPEKLAAAAFGDSRPIYQGERAADNSRIEIVLLSPDMEF